MRKILILIFPFTNQKLKHFQGLSLPFIEDGADLILGDKVGLSLLWLIMGVSFFVRQKAAMPADMASLPTDGNGYSNILGEKQIGIFRGDSVAFKTRVARLAEMADQPNTPASPAVKSKMHAVALLTAGPQLVCFLSAAGRADAPPYGNQKVFSIRVSIKREESDTKESSPAESGQRK